MSQTPSLPELPTAYQPAEAEAAVLARWSEANAFAATFPPGTGAINAATSGLTVRGTEAPHGGPDRFSIVIPPPNVTAALHLGHALNNTLQDVLIRYHRMRGDATLWMPGTDHAGIATQTVVEKRLLAEGTSRLDLGREAFIAKTQEWKDEYESVILSQLKSMGASADFDRTRFTMDDVCTAAVRHAFYVLFRDGLIYRGKRLVNWDPVTRTALADDEVEMEDVAGHMWYLRYPLSDGSGHVTVATTRPETMFGDTAVALNPNDPRAASLRGKTVTLPIVGREIPIVEDDFVVMPDPDGDAKAQFATGFLKVTPAHDPNDYEIGQRHDLPIINVMGPDASISTDYGWDDAGPDAQPFLGLSREAARDAVVAWFEDHGLLDAVRDYDHSVGHSYRSHVPIEPWLSDQWYVRVTDDRLSGAALRSQAPEQSTYTAAVSTAAGPDGTGIDPHAAVGDGDPSVGDGELRFYPARYARTFQQWHENIRDWCISRQLWWGHQIPVWNRIRPATEIDHTTAQALDGIGIDEAVSVPSRWTEAGAAHLARFVTEHEVEESVCVPQQATLDRIERIHEWSETALIEALENQGFTRDPDVLDTWFSSGLWPLSTMGWPYPQDFPETLGLLDTFNPTTLLTTAREIITLWVSRMVMFNRYFRGGTLPFRDVFIHAMIQDGHGQKMSKSLGNGVDPRDIIHSHGADAMRYTLVQMTTDTQDVRMPVDMVCPHSGTAFTPEFITTPAGHRVAAPIQRSPGDPNKTMVSAYGAATGLATPSDDQPLARNTSAKFDQGRNFANKIWNATRFALRRLSETQPMEHPLEVSELAFADRWILARLGQATATIEHALANYQFNVVADTLYDVVWRDVCDRYLEAIKPTVDDDPRQQVTLGVVLDTVLRLVHPVMPMVTETLWPHVAAAQRGQLLGVILPAHELLITATWPVIDKAIIDTDVIADFDRADALVGQIRSLRASQGVKPRQRIVFHGSASALALIERAGGYVEALAGLESVTALEDRPAIVNPLAFEGEQVFCSGLVDAVDLDAERARIQKVIESKAKQIQGFTAKLSNAGYVNNAKPELVAETRQRLAAAEADLAAAEAALAALSADG